MDGAKWRARRLIKGYNPPFQIYETACSEAWGEGSHESDDHAVRIPISGRSGIHTNVKH
jgi:hypothetical protein